MEGLVGVVGRNDLCTGTKDQLCSVLQEEGHADCRNQQGDTGCVAQRGVGDLLDDAVHHAVTQCDQCIDAAKGQAVDQLAKKHCHGLILPFFAAEDPPFGMHFFTKKAETAEQNLFRRSPQWVIYF